MFIDTHVRIAAWLHIVLGAIWVCVLALFGLFFGAFGAMLGASVHGSGAGVLASASRCSCSPSSFPCWRSSAA
jgi:hypothetical protein